MDPTNLPPYDSTPLPGSLAKSLRNEQEGTAIALVSPNGQLAIPRTWTPALLVLGGVAQVVGEELSNPAPWTGQRIFGVALKVITFLAAGVGGGIKKPGSQAVTSTARVVSNDGSAQ